MSTLFAIGGYIMTPLYWAVSLILGGFHYVFDLLGFGNTGAGWTLAIFGLTLVVRGAMIPIVAKQIKSQRTMQELQPRMRELQKKYAHDREALGRETMEMYREAGTHPVAGCLPLIIQMPIFFALYKVIYSASHGDAIGALTSAQAQSLQHAQLFGAHLADTFKDSTDIHVRILVGFLVVAMIVSQFLSMRQLMFKNMQPEALTGPVAQQQKIMMYGLPLIFLFSGWTFPIALLIYWTTSNIWSMGQQFYVIRNNPSPGTPAFKAKEERDAARAARKGLAVEGSPAAPEPETPATPPQTQRQQPKRQSRSQRKGHNRPKENR